MTSIVVLFLFGLVFGSFANVCAWRIPRGESVVSPRSRCPACRKFIPWHRNIPVLSFFLLRGRCADCRAPISWRYPLVEFSCGVLFAAQGLRFPPGGPMLLGAALSFGLLVVTLIDARHQIIPDSFSLGLLVLGLASAAWNPSLGSGTALERIVAGAVGAVFGFSLMFALAWGGEKLFKKEALGGGDIKLMAAMGAFLGWRGTFTALFIGSLLGTVVILLMMARRRLKRGDYLPFGPFLALGSWSVWMAGPFFSNALFTASELPFR